MKNLMKTFLLSVVLCTVTACSSGHKAKPETAPTPPPAPKASTPEEMQAAWAKMSTKTAEHDILRKLSGTWKATTSFWMTPDGKPEVAPASAVHTLMYDGKFLKEEFKGKAMGQPFTGLGYIGFDTVSSEFQSVWMDSMSTIMMASTGKYDAASKTITFSGQASCGLINGKQEIKNILRFDDDKHFTFEMHAPGPDGKMFRGLEIKYTKVK